VKKEWKKPKLIVIVKGTASERVLQGCRGTGYLDTGPENILGMCEINGNYCAPCLGI